MRLNACRLCLLLVPLLPAVAAAGTTAPHYHLVRLDIPGAQDVFVADINDAGQMVGYYVDADSLQHAFLWDATGPHDLATPASTQGNEVSSAATAINNSGQIVGSVQIFDERAPGVLWNSADPTQYTLLSSDGTLALTPADISDNGTVVGLRGGFQTGEAFHGFVWTATTGLVDYGSTDSSDSSINASWHAVNDAGQIIGVWNVRFSPTHASVGTVGTPAMLPLSDASDAVESGMLAIDAAGTRVGYMDVNASGNSVPVVFAADGSATALDGATLGLAAGKALAINGAGTIVGRAQDFTTLTFKAFVDVDGVAYDLYDHVDDTAGFDYFLAASAINASGTIVGVARYGDMQVGSYLAVPVGDDAIFADGFDTAAP